MKTRLILVVGLLLSATAMPAATIVQGVNFPSSIDWPTLPTTGQTVPLDIASADLLLPKFDSLLGTLNSVTLSLDSYVDLTVTFTNTTGSAQTARNSSGDANVQVTGPAATYLQAFPAIAFLSSFLVPAGGTTRHGTGSDSVGPTTYATPAVLNAFSAPGGGTVTFNLSAIGEQGSITPVGVGAVPTGSVNGTLTVVYDYNPASPTPEPATLVLFGSALLFMGIRFRKS